MNENCERNSFPSFYLAMVYSFQNLKFKFISVADFARFFPTLNSHGHLVQMVANRWREPTDTHRNYECQIMYDNEKALE